MSNFGLLEIKQLRIFLHKSLYEHMFSFLLGKYLGVDMAESCARYTFNFL